MRAPIKPTQKKIEEHELAGHVPFKAWCAFCMRARGKSFAHIAVGDKDEEAIPTVSIDYGFFGQSGETPTKSIGGDEAPVVGVNDRSSRVIWAHPLPATGVSQSDWGVKCLMRDLNMTGHMKVIVKSDQEPSIVAVFNEAKRRWSAATGAEMLPERSPVGESSSNGEIERAVQEIQGITRTMKEFVEYPADITIDPHWPIMAWMVEFAAVAYTLFSKGEPYDGLTPWQRLRGKEWQIGLPHIGEVVEYRRRAGRSWIQDGRTACFLASC